MYDSIIPGIPLPQCIALLRTQLYNGEAPSNLNLNYVEKKAFPQEYWAVAVYYYNNATLFVATTDYLSKLVLGNIGITPESVGDSVYKDIFTTVRTMYVDIFTETNINESRDSIIENIVTYVGNYSSPSVVTIYTKFLATINANYQYGLKLESTKNVKSSSLKTQPNLLDAIKSLSTDISLVGVQKALENETYLIYKKIKEYGAFNEIISMDKDVTAAINSIESYSADDLMALATEQATDLGVPIPTSAQMLVVATVLEDATKQAQEAMAYAKLLHGADTMDKKVDAVMLTLLQAQKINKEVDFSSVINGLKMYTEAKQVKENILNMAKDINKYVKNLPTLIESNALGLINSYGKTIKSVVLNDKSAFENAKADIQFYSIALHLPNLIQHPEVGPTFAKLINSNVLKSVNSYVKTANKVKLLQKGIADLKL